MWATWRGKIWQKQGHGPATHPEHPAPGRGWGPRPVGRPAAQRLFILFYFRVYPTQDVMGLFFGLSQPQVCAGVQLRNLSLARRGVHPLLKPAFVKMRTTACAAENNALGKNFRLWIIHPLREF